MKNKFLLLLMIFSMIITFNLTAQNKAAVLPFTAGENIDRFMTAAAGESFNKALSKSDKYTIVNQGDVFRQLTDISMYLVREFDIQTAVKVGQAVGADVVFTGNVIRESDKYQIFVQCIDISSGTVLFTKNGFSEATAQLSQLSSVIASDICFNAEMNENVEMQSLTKFEQREKNNLSMKNIDITNAAIMKHIYNMRLAAGISMVVSGTVGFGVGGGVLGIAMHLMNLDYQERQSLGKDFDNLSDDDKKYWQGEESNEDGEYLYGKRQYIAHNQTTNYDLPVIATCVLSPVLMSLGFIAAVLSAIPFYAAHQMKSIYYKYTKQKLFSFLQRTSVTGGYDWTRREATFAMAIKL